MNRRLMMASALIVLSAAALAWLLDMPGWLAALLSALAVLPLPWWSSQRQAAAWQESLVAAQRAFQSSAQAGLLLDAQGQASSANPAFMALAQLAPGSAPGTLMSALPPAWQTLIQTLHQQALTTSAAQAESMLPHGSQTALLRAYALPLRSPSGEHQTLLLWENLSDKDQALNQLLAREQHLLAHSQAFVQTLIDVIPQPVYIKHIDSEHSHYAQVNTAFCALHNRSRHELVGPDAANLFGDPAHTAMIHQEDLRVLSGMPLYREEQTLDEQTGKDRFSIICKQTCEDAEGRKVIIGTHFDITPWRMAERNLKMVLQREVDRREQAQQFIQRIIDVIPYPVHVKDSHSRYLMINEAFVRERGRSREELLGQDPASVVKLMVGEDIGAENTERTRALLSLKEDHDILNGGTLTKEEHNLHSVTGAERFRTVFKSGCLDTEGKPAIVTAFFDVTQWRIAERNLSEALNTQKNLLERTHAFTQRLIDLIPEEFYVKDADNRYLLVNQAFLARRHLRSADQVIGRSVEEIAQAMSEANPAYRGQPERLANAVAEHIESIKKSHEEDLSVLAGQSLFKEEHYHVPHTGEEQIYNVAKTCCEDPQGRQVIVSMSVNLTAQRLAEHKLMTLAPPSGKAV